MMKGRKKDRLSVLSAVAFCLLTAALTAAVLAGYHSRQQFALLDSLCQRLLQKQAADSTALLQAVREERDRLLSGTAPLKDLDGLEGLDNLDGPDAPIWRILGRTESAGGGVLRAYGYGPTDFIPGGWSFAVWTAVLCGAAGAFLSVLFLWQRDRAERARIRALTGYLEKVHMGGPGLLSQGGLAKTTRHYPSMAPVEEGEYGRLQDEIYKTVTSLYRTRDEALASKKGYADNLQNIAHQLKTPITAISLSAQMLGEKRDLEDYSQAGRQIQGQKRVQRQSLEQIQEQIQKQVARLTHLEEALLLLARIDAGVLSLQEQAVDVFTLLTLAADELGPLITQADLSIAVPEMGQVQIQVDMEWMMEAVMNLLKDCIEHSPAGGVVHCAYEEELLYVKIRIWDEGTGFFAEDLPYLFQRFYRGKDAPAGGIGIGLSLSRELIEMQDGSLTAGNLPEGGAFFEIRMYSH